MNRNHIQAHQEVSQLRAELQDTNSRIANMAAAVQVSPPPPVGIVAAGSGSASDTSTCPVGSTSSQRAASPSKSCSGCHECPSRNAHNGDIQDDQKSEAQKNAMTTVIRSERGDTLTAEEQLSRLQEDKEELVQHNLNLQRELDELRASQQQVISEAKEEHNRMEGELSNAKEALAGQYTL